MSKYASRWEEEYAHILELLKRQGSIRDFCFEPMRILLAEKTSYLPDFLVVTNTGKMEFHEVKGFIRDDAMIKFKIAAEKYPMFDFLMLTKHNGVWDTIREYRSGACIKSVKVKPSTPKPKKGEPDYKITRLPNVTEWNPTEFYAFRTYLKLSPLQIAINIGVSEKMWSHWEDGKTTIYGKQIKLVQDFYNSFKESFK